MKKLLMLICILWFGTKSFGQSDLVVQSFIKLPKDSVISYNLIQGLNEFLQNPEPDNSHIALKDRLETLALVAEMKDIRKNEKHKNDQFYRPYLENIISINDSVYLIQVSYIGIDGNEPVIRASFDLMGRVSEKNEFTFSSPISMNTSTWNKEKIGDFTFYYKNELDIATVNNYMDTKLLYDKKLGNKNEKVKVYCCSNSFEVMKISGLRYKMDYNGRKNLSLDYTSGDETVSVASYYGESFSDFDPHDLFHWCASKAIPEDKYNHYMACGGGYLYGGSWGIGWNDIKVRFRETMLGKKNTDWLKLYIERYNFGESKERHLLITQFINALLIEKMEKEKGFSSVKELLASGNFREEKDKFFANLNRITGINEKNFNNEVEKLIRDMK